MNLSMYVDNEKNLVMFLPDNMTSHEIVSLGEMVYPDPQYMKDDFLKITKKPTGYVNLYNTHASFETEHLFLDNVNTYRYREN